METVIKFPLPDSISLFESTNFQEIEPFCLCYQYNIKNILGPYGFDTEKSMFFLDKVFNGVSNWNCDTKRFGEKFLLSNNVINFYDKDIEHLKREVLLYNQQFKKIELLNRLNKISSISSLEIPTLYKLFDTDKKIYRAEVIKKILYNGNLFFLSAFFTPEAGRTIILFDKSIIGRIVKSCRDLDLNYKEYESINKLNPW